MSPTDAYMVHIDSDGTITRVTAEERSYREIRLHPSWCQCPRPEFHSYPSDGACSCGSWKHHVHCAICGCISQVG